MSAQPFGRGDYGTEYAGDLIEKIEGWNCVKGCTHAGTRAQREEFGPGGVCALLAAVFAEVYVLELERRDDRVHCTKRQDPAVAGMTPLFGGDT